MHVTSRAPSSFTNSTWSTRFCNANYRPTLNSRARLPPSSRKLNWFSIKKLPPRDCSDNYLFKLFLVGIKWLRLSFLDADTETRLFAIQFTPQRHGFSHWIRSFAMNVFKGLCGRFPRHQTHLYEFLVVTFDWKHAIYQNWKVVQVWRWIESYFVQWIDRNTTD